MEVKERILRDSIVDGIMSLIGMAFKGYLYILIGVFTLVISSSVNITQAVAPSLNRTSFPPGFIFGTASSAYQILVTQ
ncbi:hypothetical protein JHK82_030844 [Glycine max]|nr:hypothetical protein JHK82_030844 [Glycine max]